MVVMLHGTAVAAASGTSTTPGTGGSVFINGGPYGSNGGGGDANGGNVNIDGGTTTGSGFPGYIFIGNAVGNVQIQIGTGANSTLNVGGFNNAVTVNAGNQVILGQNAGPASGSTPAGTAGTVTITSGVGGGATTTAGGTATAGGVLALAGGAGGPSAASTNGPGAGGAVTITGGGAGTATTGGANGGAVTINAGAKTGTGTNGNINIGTSNTAITTMGATAGVGWVQQAANASRLASAVTNSTATLSSGVMTNLSLTLVAGRKYFGRLVVFAKNATAASGLQFDFGGGTCTATSVTFGFAGTPIGWTMSTNLSTALATTIKVTTATTTDVVCVIEFAMVCNAAGTLIPRIANNSGATVATADVGTNFHLYDSPN